MVPSRGWRPAHIAQLQSRQSLCARIPSSRQFSSAPRTSNLSASTRRSHPFHAARWRTGASNPHDATITAHSVRHGSWYAPWTWGSSGSPASEAPDSTQTFASQHVLDSQSTVTTTTPELAPAGIDKAAVVDTASAGTGAGQHALGSVEELVDNILKEPDAPVAPMSSYSGDPTTAIDRIGALKDMGLDFGWGPTSTFEWLIEHVYLMSPWGWGGAIIASTVILRTSLFYFNWKASSNMAKLAALTPLMRDQNERLKKAMQEGDQEAAAYYRSRIGGTYKEAGINPISGLIPIGFQAAFGFGAFRCIRNMAELPVPGMEQSGFLWFQNLAIADPYYILPALGGGFMYLFIKFGGESGTNPQLMEKRGPQQVVMTAIPVMITLVTAFQPAGIALYIVTTSVIGGLQSILLRNSAFRSATGMTPLPTKESHAIWARVASGELKISDVIDKHGNIVYKHESVSSTPSYQAPRTINVSAKPSNTTKPASSKFSRPTSKPAPQPTQFRGLNIRAGAQLPPHLQRPATPLTYVSRHDPKADRDSDFDIGPQGKVTDKLDWVTRNYRPSFVYRRMKKYFLESNMGVKWEYEKKVEQQKQREKREREARRRERERRGEL